MSKNTSVSLGSYYDEFVKSSLNAGRYKNASEVIRAGLRLLEEEDNKVMALKNAIHDGLESGIATDFNPNSHLKELKAKRKSNG
jgi:antitoxin ParD1/3/4